jgi:Flp pilus assembly protein TadD
MILTAVIGALTALGVLVIARPFLGAQRSGSRVGARSRRVLVVLVAAAAALGVSALLLQDTSPAVSVASPPASGPGAQPTPADPAAARAAATTAARAAVAAAVQQVQRHPRRVPAHLSLAHAYAAAGRPQLATVEYLAVVHLEPGNPEANTALALAAFRSGRFRTAVRMLDLALRTRPGYPEALYTRGLVNAMGLNRPAAARRDLHAYLRAAPFGSHRTTVATVLALLDGRSRR